MMGEDVINAAIIDSLDNFSYARSMAEAYVREQLMTQEERKAEERTDRIERIVCGAAFGMFSLFIGLLYALA